MRNAILGFSLLALLASLPAAAQVTPPGQSMSYTYIEGGWSRVNIDPGSGFSSVNENGFNLRGSAQFSDNVYAVGSWDRWEIGPFDRDTDLTRLGLGFRAALGRDFDWFAEGTWTHIDIDGIGSENGARLDVGLRRMLNRIAEVRGFAGYNVDGPEGDSFVFGGDLLFHVTSVLGISAGVESYEFDTNVVRVNLRGSF